MPWSASNVRRRGWNGDGGLSTDSQASYRFWIQTVVFLFKLAKFFRDESPSSRSPNPPSRWLKTPQLAIRGILFTHSNFRPFLLHPFSLLRHCFRATRKLLDIYNLLNVFAKHPESPTNLTSLGGYIWIVLPLRLIEENEALNIFRSTFFFQL